MSLAKTALLATVFAASATLAMAAGSDSTTPPKPTATTTQCSNAQVFDPKTNTCVDARQGNLSDDQRYDAARELAYDGQYENALIILAAAEDQNDPRILNYKGLAVGKALVVQDARELAYDGQYENALIILAAAEDQND
ncbi:MAG: hypothetical protein AAFY59_10000, partial [Pseudomonadota bacterium]